MASWSPSDDAAVLARVAGNLYDALDSARGYIAATVDRRRELPDERAVALDAALLERVDAALADAGEYLTGGES